MAIREGKWRCPACQTVNPGRETACSACGKVRGPEVRFFLEDDAPETRDQAGLDLAKGGADWHCAFCNTDNRASEATCHQCGASQADSTKRAVQIRADSSEAGLNAGSQAFAAPGGGVAAPGPRPLPKGILALVVSLSLAVLVSGIVALVFWSRGSEMTLELTGGSWERSIELEHQELVRHEAWADQVPGGGQVMRTWEAQRSTRQVQTGTQHVKTGTRDLGNGFFEDVYEDRPVYRDEPVYDTRAEYQIWEWVVWRSVQSFGTLADSPVWPQVRLESGEKEGRRQETATMVFKSNDPENAGKTYTWEGLKPDELAPWQPGRSYELMVRGQTVVGLPGE